MKNNIFFYMDDCDLLPPKFRRNLYYHNRKSYLRRKIFWQKLDSEYPKKKWNKK